MVNKVSMVFYLIKGRLLSPLKRWKDHADHATMHLPQLPDSDIVGSRIGFGSMTCSLPTPVDVLEGQSPKIFIEPFIREITVKPRPWIGIGVSLPIFPPNFGD